MLIYNHHKEFLGIDKDDLNTLGCENLEELIAESNDFADLFVKKPGYIHNFKHVNWIDFVACADSIENTKVIIKAKGRSFRSLLEVKTAYLLDSPSSKSFLVYLTNIRELLDSDSNDTSENFLQTPSLPIAPVFTPPKIEIQETAFENQPSIPDEAEISVKEVFPSAIELEDSSQMYHDIEINENSLEEDLKIDLEMDDTFTIAEQIAVEPKMEIFDNGYIFDPHVASEELGLPVDLIEEFIEDFIAQAKEFQEALYTALDDGDDDNIKILSHKLKGVAANLRIEDALESLTIINQSENSSEIKKHLDILYNIIAKLAGEKIEITQYTAEDTPAEEIIDDFHDFDEEMNDSELLYIDAVTDSRTEDTELDLEIFKTQEPKIKIQEDELDIRIEIPELADDDFLKKVDDEPASEYVAEEMKETKIINYHINHVAREIGLSEENFMELFQDYLEEAHILSDAISDAIKENLPQKWKTKAQQLKGMSDNMRVKDLMKDLQKMIETQDLCVAEEANTQIKELLTEISKIKG